MSNIIKAGLDAIKKGVDSLKNIKQEKRAYKEYLARIKALPEEYAFVYNKIATYMWSNSGGGDGYDMVTLQAGVLELFEEGAAEGKKVLEVTGEDVAAFSDELLRSARTYSENRRQKLNREIKTNVDHW